MQMKKKPSHRLDAKAFLAFSKAINGLAAGAGLDETCELLVEQQGEEGENQSLHKVKRSSTKDDISVDAVNHRIDCVAGIDDCFQRHDLGVEWNEHKPVWVESI